LERQHSFIAKVGTNFRITIPEPIRKVLQIKKGEYVEVLIKKLVENNEVKG